MANDRRGASRVLLEALAVSDAFEHGPAEYTFYNGLGWSLHEVDPEQAIVHYRKACTIVPPPAQHAHYNLMNLLTSRGALADAAAVVRNLFENAQPDAKQLHQLAKLEVDAGLHRDALATYVCSPPRPLQSACGPSSPSSSDILCH